MEDNLFLTAETHWAAKAAQGRVQAINAAKDLHWVVEVEGATLTFEVAPTFFEIAKAAHAQGVEGQVLVRSITVGRKKPRPLLLLPWMRLRARERQALAAE